MGKRMIHYVGFALAVYILISLLIVGVWDIYWLLLIGDETNTVSAYLTQWAVRFPIGAVAVGILIGHLFWPTARR